MKVWDKALPTWTLQVLGWWGEDLGGHYGIEVLSQGEGYSDE